MPLGWRATSQRHQECFLLAIHFAWRTRARVFLQGIVQTAEHEFLAGAFNRCDTDLERGGDFLIAECLMRHSQNVSTCKATDSDFAFAGQNVECDLIFVL